MKNTSVTKMDIAWKRIFKQINQRKVGGGILVSNNIDVKPELIKRHKEGYFILIQEKSTKIMFHFLTLIAPNRRALTCVKVALLSLNHTSNLTH